MDYRKFIAKIKGFFKTSFSGKNALFASNYLLIP